MTTPSHRPVAAGVIAADPDNVAPVSGPRCRGCGANAGRAPVGQEWTVTDGAAYCPGCREVPVDVPPGASLIDLARLAADAPEVRREVVTAPLLKAGLSLIGGDLCVCLFAAGKVVRIPEAEAARRLLAFDGLLAACKTAEEALAYHAGQRLSNRGDHAALAVVRAAIAAAKPQPQPRGDATNEPADRQV